MKFDLGSLTSTSEGWALVSWYAVVLGGEHAIDIPEIVAANATLMAWIIVVKLLALAIPTAIYINGRSRVKEAGATGKESA